MSIDAACSKERADKTISLMKYSGGSTLSKRISSINKSDTSFSWSCLRAVPARWNRD